SAFPLLLSLPVLADLVIERSSNYTQDENFRFLPGILSNSNFTKDLSKVTNIELTAHMIAVNNYKDSVSPLLLAAKPKKWKSQTLTLTLPKSQGLEVPRALSKKSKRPKSKNPPTKTKVTPPKPTEGTDAKYQVNQTQSTRLRYQSLPKNKCKPSYVGELDTQPILESTYADVRAFLLSDDESEEDILEAGEEIDEEPQVASIAETHHQSPPP
ncbi:hypothetical protein Tco_1342052, partial [Tanacetum coccineum]